MVHSKDIRYPFYDTARLREAVGLHEKSWLGYAIFKKDKKTWR